MKRGPSKNFFAVDNHVWEAMLYRYRVPSMDRRVFGFVVRKSWGIRASESYEVNREKVAAALGVHPRTVERAIQSLIHHGALTCVREPRRSKPGRYAPNKLAETWTYPLEEGVSPLKNRYAGSAYPTGELGTQDQRTQCELGTQDQRTQRDQTCVPFRRASPTPTRRRSRSEIHSLNTHNKIQNTRPDGRDFDALFQEAKTTYKKQTGYSLNREEERELREFFDLSQHTGTLLKIWELAIDNATQDRAIRREDPEQAKYVPRRPFADVYRFAADDYATRKAAQQDRPKRLAAA